MAGSDWPVCLLHASYDEVTMATDELLSGLNPAERADVLGDTAVRWYGLVAGER
jgi:L-fuconolactonase